MVTSSRCITLLFNLTSFDLSSIELKEMKHYGGEHPSVASGSLVLCLQQLDLLSVILW